MSFLRKKEAFTSERPSSTQVVVGEVKCEEIKLSRVKSFPSSVRRTVRQKTETPSLEELVQCGICLERLSVPKMLPCQHTFCLSCLKTYVIAKHVGNKNSYTMTEIKNSLSQNSFTLGCPTCRKEVTFTNGIDSLDELPNNLYIDSLLKVLESEDTVIATEKVKEVRCIKCQTICQPKEHNCAHCKMNFCTVCWSEHAKELQQKCQVFLKQLSESREALAYKSQDLERSCNQLKESVNQGVEEKLQYYRKLQQNLFDEVDHITTKSQERFVELQEKCLLLTKEIQDSGSSNLGMDIMVTDYMKYHNEMSSLLQDISQFGETNKIFDPDSFKLEESIGYSSKLDGPKNFVSDECSHSEYYKNRSFRTKLVWNKCPKPAGVAIPPWNSNLVYIAATQSKTILILHKKTNKLLGRLSYPDMICPYNLDFNSVSKEIFVSDNWKHCIHVFSKDGDYLRCLCSKGQDSGQLISPQGIKFNHENNLVVCDTGNDRVLIIDPETGKQIGTIGLSDEKTEFRNPTDVAIFDGKIFVADSGNNKVKVFDSNKNKIFEFGALGKSRGQFRCIEAVAVDQLGCILVGDAGNGRVQIFDSEGNFIKTFGSSSKTKFDWVSGIFVGQGHEIIVTDHKNKCLYMF